MKSAGFNEDKFLLDRSIVLKGCLNFFKIEVISGVLLLERMVNS